VEIKDETVGRVETSIVKGVEGGALEELFSRILEKELDFRIALEKGLDVSIKAKDANGDGGGGIVKAACFKTAELLAENDVPFTHETGVNENVDFRFGR